MSSRNGLPMYPKKLDPDRAPSTMKPKLAEYWKKGSRVEMHDNSLCEICDAFGANGIMRKEWKDSLGESRAKDYRVCYLKSCRDAVRGVA